MTSLASQIPTHADRTCRMTRRPTRSGPRAHRALADPRVLPPVVTDSIYVDAVVVRAYG